MTFYCKHYQTTVPKGKAISYCLKSNCWAIKLLSHMDKLKRINGKLTLLPKKK